MSFLDRLRDAFIFYRTRGEFNRKLPLVEALSDRFEYAKELGFGEGSSIYANTYLYNPDRIKVGKHTWIGPFVILDASGGEIVIGDYCSISAGVQIYTHDSRYWARTHGKVSIKKGPGIIIGNGVHVGPNAVIPRGSVIKDGEFVMPCSFYWKDTE